MSLDVSVWVWKHADASGARLLVLLALADIADHEGLCWPSVPTLAQRTRLHEQTVRGHLNELREAGAIEVEAVPGRSNRYRVLMPDTPANIATPSDSRTPTEPLEGTPTKVVEGTPTKPIKTNSHNSQELSVEVDEADLPKGTSSALGLPKPFTVTREMRSWAVGAVPSLDVDEVTREFVEYWREGEGRGKRKKNWTLTWRNWLKRAHQRNVERGWVPVRADAAPMVALPAWLATLRIPVEEYLERREDAGWVADMQRQAEARAS